MAYSYCRPMKLLHFLQWSLAYVQEMDNH